MSARIQLNTHIKYAHISEIIKLQAATVSI